MSVPLRPARPSGALPLPAKLGAAFLVAGCCAVLSRLLFGWPATPQLGDILSYAVLSFGVCLWALVLVLSVRYLRSGEGDFALGLGGFTVAVLIGWEVVRAIWWRA